MPDTGKPLCHPSQPPHEYGPGIRPKDATDKEARTPRSRGRPTILSGSASLVGNREFGYFQSQHRCPGLAAAAQAAPRVIQTERGVRAAGPTSLKAIKMWRHAITVVTELSTPVMIP
jgi:hypothetical protein